MAQRAVVRFLILSIVLLGAVEGSFASDKIVVGYYPAWHRYSFPAEKVAFENFTHLAHAFVWPNADGSLATYPDFHYPQLIEKTHVAGKRILVSFGGWGQSAGFSPMAANPTARAKFVDNVKNFCLTYKYDGVDLDWEYPQAASDRPNLTTLVKELRQAFNALNPPLLLTMAVPTGSWTGSRYDFSALKDLLDWIGCMTYDFHGSWTNHAGHLAPLYAPSNDPEGSADLSIKYLISLGIPRTKILMGLPFYGREFNATALYGPSTGGTAVNYNEAIRRIAGGWTYYWDDLSKVPYLTDPNHTKLHSFDDTVSIRIKCEYIRQQNLGGAKIWALGMDDMGTSQPLLETIGRELGMISAVAETPIVEEMPTTPTLLANYPNPFNASTTIRYYIPAAAKVQLELFDLTGRSVALLVDEERSAGWHRVVFEATNLPSGLYFYRIRVGNFREPHKMTLIR